MHDLRALREQAGELRAAMRRRGQDQQLAPIIDRAVELDGDRRATIQAVEERKAARNALSQEVARRKKAGESADEAQASSRALGDEIKGLEEKSKAAQEKLDALALVLPNSPLADVPTGADEHGILNDWHEHIEQRLPQAIRCGSDMVARHRLNASATKFSSDDSHDYSIGLPYFFKYSSEHTISSAS